VVFEFAVIGIDDIIKLQLAHLAGPEIQANDCPIGIIRAAVRFEAIRSPNIPSENCPAVFQSSVIPVFAGMRNTGISEIKV